MRRLPRPMDDEERREIIRLAGTDLKYREIAARVDRPFGSVSNVINKAIHTGMLQARGKLLERVTTPWR